MLLGSTLTGAELQRPDSGGRGLLLDSQSVRTLRLSGEATGGEKGLLSPRSTPAQLCAKEEALMTLTPAP